MVCLWYVYGMSVCLWFVYGLSMVCLWLVYGLSMVCLWFVYGLSMVCLWCQFALIRALEENGPHSGCKICPFSRKTCPLSQGHLFNGRGSSGHWWFKGGFQPKKMTSARTHAASGPKSSDPSSWLDLLASFGC